MDGWEKTERMDWWMDGDMEGGREELERCMRSPQEKPRAPSSSVFPMVQPCHAGS
jgi:hypothetical protein